MPSLTIYHNINEEWFKKFQFDNNINSIGNIESLKLKRLNSCKPNIVINRDYTKYLIYLIMSGI